MGGGLIQIASYGLQDIFLIGNPQITFFKTVYRKHTNFSMEYIQEYFDGIQNFGNYLTCNISKAGDLMHRLYLKIEIPQVLLNSSNGFQNNSNQNQNSIYQNFKSDYDKLTYYLNQINYYMIQPLYKLLNLSDFNYIDLETKYELLYNSISYPILISTIQNINIESYKTYATILVNNNNQYVISSFNETQIVNFLNFDMYYKKYIKPITFNNLKTFLDDYVTHIKIIKSHLFKQLNIYKEMDLKMNRSSLNFAWVENIGLQIIDRVEIEIGGKMIDFTDAVRMNINYQLSNSRYHDITYNRLIGNISSLTEFNTDIKPFYTMIIPIDFWFSKYSGLSIPLIYLRYHDVKINLKLNDLINCCYFEKLDDGVMIENLINLYSVSLIVNYIYLDNDERQKFAQLQHEYLIEQTQIAMYDNIITEQINVELPFFNPIKQLFWLARDNDNIARLKYFEYSCNYYVDIYQFLYDNTQKLLRIRTTNNLDLSMNILSGDEIEIVNSIYYSGKYIVKSIVDEYLFVKFYYYLPEDYSYNYDIVDTSYVKSPYYLGNFQAYVKKIVNINPIEKSTLELNGIHRFYKTDDIYNNFVQPYQSNTRSPDYGLNTYSFGLSSQEYQSSGFCNFNGLNLKIMILKFNKKFFNRNLNLLLYSYGYNVLRFENGKAGLVLNI